MKITKEELVNIIKEEIERIEKHPLRESMRETEFWKAGDDTRKVAQNLEASGDDLTPPLNAWSDGRVDPEEYSLYELASVQKDYDAAYMSYREMVIIGEYFMNIGEDGLKRTKTKLKVLNSLLDAMEEEGITL